MIRIAGYTIDSNVNYRAGESGADIEIMVPFNTALTDEDITALKNATLIEELRNSYGTVGDVISEYVLVGWKAIERTPKGIFFRWQTYRTTDLDALRQENEELTEAILELAQIVGGGNG